MTEMTSTLQTHPPCHRSSAEHAALMTYESDVQQQQQHDAPASMPIRSTTGELRRTTLKASSTHGK